MLSLGEREFDTLPVEGSNPYRSIGLMRKVQARRRAGPRGYGHPHGADTFALLQFFSIYPGIYSLGDRPLHGAVNAPRGAFAEREGTLFNSLILSVLFLSRRLLLALVQCLLVLVQRFSWKNCV